MIRPNRLTWATRRSGRFLPMSWATHSDPLPYVQLALGGVVENVKSDLVADAAPAQQVRVEEPIQGLVQSLIQAVGHDAT